MEVSMRDGYAPGVCEAFMRIAGGAAQRRPKRGSGLLGATIECEDAVRLGAVDVSLRAATGQGEVL